MIYYMFIATFLFIGFFSKYPKLHFKVSMIILFIFTAFRDVGLGGSDALSYQNFFYNSVPSIGKIREYSADYEYGYALINSIIKTISNDYRLYQVIYSAIVITLLYYVVNNMKLSSREKCLFLFIYFCYRFFLNNFVLLRQNIANLMIWLVILKYYEKPFKANMLTASSWFFHRTSLANIIILPLINKLENVNKHKMLIGTIIFSGIAIITSKNIINKLVSMLIIFAGDKYTKYFIDGDIATGFNVINYILRWVFILILYLFYENITNEKKNLFLYVGLFAIGIGSFNTEIFTRMLEYYMIAIYGSITISHQAFSRESKKLYLMAVYASFMIILIRSLFTTSGGMFMNYSFFWN